jgi:nucleotide-binding universal stress UspA family protein
MMQKSVEHIICAVRGRPTSRKTVTRAIDLALEHEAKLTFIHVVNAEFLGQAAPTMSPLRMVFRRLKEMGEFAMLILVDRAERRGVEQVDYRIREGNIPVQLLALAEELDGDILVIGRPLMEPGKAVFAQEEFERFVQQLETEKGMRIIQIDTSEGEKE